VRLFTGIALPSHVLDRLLTLCSGVPGARWQDREQMHLTLRFIGEVDGKSFDDMRLALAQVRSSQFSLTLDSVGHFGERKRVHALWVGVPMVRELIALRDRIESVLVRYGQEPESRKYKPHVTLARLRDAPLDRVVSFLSANALFLAGPFAVEEFHLYSSHPGGGGSLYRIEESYPLNVVGAS